MLDTHGNNYNRVLSLYGPASKRDEVRRKLVWATPGQRGFTQTTGSSGGTGSSNFGIVMPARSYDYSGRTQAMPTPTVGLPSRAGSSAASASAQVQARQELMRKQQEAFKKHRDDALRRQQESVAKAAELKSMLTTLEKVDDEGRRSSLLDTICAAEDILALSEYPDPPCIANGLLNVNLMKHQVCAQSNAMDKTDY